jgi:hypothetical protein
MRNVNQIFANLRKAVNGSKPNTKYKQIMSYIDVLEETIKDGCCGSNQDTNNNSPSEETNENVGNLSNTEGGDTLPTDGLDGDTVEDVNLEDLNLKELRELYPDIKATSKDQFLNILATLNNEEEE